MPKSVANLTITKGFSTIGYKYTVCNKSTLYKIQIVHNTQAFYTSLALNDYRFCIVNLWKILAIRIQDNITFLTNNI